MHNHLLILYYCVSDTYSWSIRAFLFYLSCFKNTKYTESTDIIKTIALSIHIKQINSNTLYFPHIKVGN